MNIKKIILTSVVVVVASALLAVGIYAAATTSKYSTTGSTVTFTADDAFVDITFKVQHFDADGTSNPVDKLTAGSITGGTGGNQTFTTGTITTKTYTGTTGSRKITAANHAGIASVGNVALTEEKSVVKYTYTFENVGSNEITVTIKRDAASLLSVNYTDEVTLAIAGTNNNDSGNPLNPALAFASESCSFDMAAGAKYTITVTFTVNDFGITLAGNDTDMDFEVSFAKKSA